MSSSQVQIAETLPAEKEGAVAQEKDFKKPKFNIISLREEMVKAKPHLY